MAHQSQRGNGHRARSHDGWQDRKGNGKKKIQSNSGGHRNKYKQHSKADANQARLAMQAEAALRRPVEEKFPTYPRW